MLKSDILQAKLDQLHTDEERVAQLKEWYSFKIPFVSIEQWDDEWNELDDIVRAYHHYKELTLDKEVIK